MESPKLDIHLYMTTHDDELPDLHTMEHVEEVKKWFADVDDVAVHHDHYSKIDDELIKEAGKHHILNCHSVVFYPPGKLLDANAVGRNLNEFFKKHRKKFDWHIAPNPSLKDVYEVYLEIVVRTEGEDAGEADESLEERNQRILAEAHKDENPQPGLHERLSKPPTFNKG